MGPAISQISGAYSMLRYRHYVSILSIRAIDPKREHSRETGRNCTLGGTKDKQLLGPHLTGHFLSLDRISRPRLTSRSPPLVEQYIRCVRRLAI